MVALRFWGLQKGFFSKRFIKPEDQFYAFKFQSYSFGYITASTSSSLADVDVSTLTPLL